MRFGGTTYSNNGEANGKGHGKQTGNWDCIGFAGIMVQDFGAGSKLWALDWVDLRHARGM